MFIAKITCDLVPKNILVCCQIQLNFGYLDYSDSTWVYRNGVLNSTQNSCTLCWWVACWPPHITVLKIHFGPPHVWPLPKWLPTDQHLGMLHMLPREDLEATSFLPMQGMQCMHCSTSSWSDRKRVMRPCSGRFG